MEGEVNGNLYPLRKSPFVRMSIKPQCTVHTDGYVTVQHSLSPTERNRGQKQPRRLQQSGPTFEGDFWGHNLLGASEQPPPPPPGGEALPSPSNGLFHTVVTWWSRRAARPAHGGGRRSVH